MRIIILMIKFEWNQYVKLINSFKFFFIINRYEVIKIMAKSSTNKSDRIPISHRDAIPPL